MLAKTQLTDGPCALDGDLVCEHVPSKKFHGLNFCCDGMSTLSKLKKDSKYDCSIRIVDCFIRVIPFNVCKSTLN